MQHWQVSSPFALMIQSGDVVLEENFQTASKNATNQFKTVQNELIHCNCTAIKDKTASEVKNAEFFSVLANEAKT